jgi:phosphoesterase RecJ-like protein
LKQLKGIMEAKLNDNIFSSDVLQGAWNLIQKSKKITLLTHEKPDGDGVSACAALDHVLQKYGKETETIYPNEPEFEIKRQSHKTLMARHEMVPDLIIACDTASYNRLYFPETFKKIPLINIDHHISNSIQGTYNLINTNTTSTCEDLYIILKAWDPASVDRYVAECLLFGILYDSQVFHIQSTTSRSLRIAAELMEHGADLYQLKTELLSRQNPQTIALWGKFMSTISVSENKKAAWAVITQTDLKKFGVTLSSLAGFNNFLAQICDIDVTALFYETESGQTKVSLRSKETDVIALAAKFGGG